MNAIEVQHLARTFKEIRALDGIIAFSHYYADFMSDYLMIPRERIHVVPLGLNTRDFRGEPPERNGGPPRLGYLPLSTAKLAVRSQKYQHENGILSLLAAPLSLQLNRWSKQQQPGVATSS